MSCCGKGREQLSTTFQPEVAEQAVRELPTRPAPRFAIDFEYTGTTGLTVEGPVTGKTYRFEQGQGRVAVDVRDMAGIEQVPKLRRVE
jgi:hypothetical protein